MRKDEDKVTEQYDSTDDTLTHMLNIRNVMDLVIIPELQKRCDTHDLSKLGKPEKECYDKYIPKLKTEKYGTPEYMELRKNMEKDGLLHHYRENRHHPEHFKNGVNDMDLIDLLEMVCDWFAASLVSDTTFKEGLEGNFKRQKIDKQLSGIIENTYNNYLKEYEKCVKENNESETQSYFKDIQLRIYENEAKGKITRELADKLIFRVKQLQDKNRMDRVDKFRYLDINWRQFD